MKTIIGRECVRRLHQQDREQPEAHLATAQGRRKYLFTDQIDQFICEIYFNHPGAKTRPGVRMLAKKLGIPHWALKKRARELGLARTKEKPWSDAELEILQRYAWMTDERIRLKLKAAGYSRTTEHVTLLHQRPRDTSCGDGVFGRQTPAGAISSNPFLDRSGSFS